LSQICVIGPMDKAMSLWDFRISCTLSCRTIIVCVSVCRSKPCQVNRTKYGKNNRSHYFLLLFYLSPGSVNQPAWQSVWKWTEIEIYTEGNLRTQERFRARNQYELYICEKRMDTG
jgi:hypothetical protein